MLERVQQNRRYFPLLLIAAWTAFGIFFGIQNYVRDLYLGRQASLPGYVASWILCGYSWGILTVPVIQIARRFSPQHLGWLRFFAAHIPLAATLALVQLGIYVVIASVLFGLRGRGMAEFYGIIAANEFQSSFLVYFVIVSAVFAYDKWFGDAGRGDQTIEFKSSQNGHVRRFSIKENGRILLVDVDDINWVQSYGNYVFLHTDERRYILRETMTAIERKLDPERFVRVRRSAIVRSDQIAELRLAVNGEYEVKLLCGESVASTRHYRKNLENYIRN